MISKFVPEQRVSKSWQELAQQSWSHLKELKMNPKFLGLKPIFGLFKYPMIDKRMLETILKLCGNFMLKIDLEEFENCALSTIAEYSPNISSITCRIVSVAGLKKLSKIAETLRK